MHESSFATIKIIFFQMIACNINNNNGQKSCRITSKCVVNSIVLTSPFHIIQVTNKSYITKLYR